ncbi:MAG: helix-turn-helix transcriptional regulator [Lachnospiraceae bacterium]|jgi:transcriptional regulator with XRE-family HTH domain|nr:helix-turn-helix transcriptional regulator [Lachnospiraceae bacterium]
MNRMVIALGEAVRTTRKNKNLSQEALAEKVGVCKRTIIDIEKNSGNPKFEILCTLVRELDLPLYQIFYPEVTENYEIKNVLIRELDNCSEYEMRIILSLVRSLRYTLKNEETVYFGE